MIYHSIDFYIVILYGSNPLTKFLLKKEKEKRAAQEGPKPTMYNYTYTYIYSAQTALTYIPLNKEKELLRWDLNPL